MFCRADVRAAATTKPQLSAAPQRIDQLNIPKSRTQDPSLQTSPLASGNRQASTAMAASAGTDLAMGLREEIMGDGSQTMRKKLGKKVSQTLNALRTLTLHAFR
jgi:hypothetical protein